MSTEARRAPLQKGEHNAIVTTSTRVIRSRGQTVIVVVGHPNAETKRNSIGHGSSCTELIFHDEMHSYGSEDENEGIL